MKTKKADMKIINKADIIVLCTIVGFALLCAVLYFGINLAYSKTTVPDGLSAQETVEQYFEYWDAGNNTGQNLIVSASYSKEEMPWYECLSLTDLIDRIEVASISQLDTVPDYATRYADYVVFDVKYTKTIDNGWQGHSKGDNYTFIGVCKETEDSPWRIDNIFTGW